MFDGSNGLGEFTKTIGDAFINVSAEYPVILDGTLYLMGAAGVLIAGSAAFDFMRLGRKDSAGSGSSPSTIFWKILGGTSLVDLTLWAQAWTSTLWSMTDPMDISAYSSASGEDYAKTAIMAVLGFITIAGYVTMGRAYFMMSKLGYLSAESRSDMIGSIISRIVAGSAMIAMLHISKMLDNSTGFNWMPS